MSGTASIIYVGSVSNPVLYAGTPYWLMISAPDPDNDWSAWNHSSPAVTGSVLQRFGSDPWIAGSTMPAFRILGESEIPEPGTCVLMITGLAALLVGARRRCRG
jgi:hypothetical protein